MYFFEVEPRDAAVAHITKQYHTPGEAAKQEDKKWYMASQATRYGSSRHAGQNAKPKGRGYQIVDRAKPLEMLEIRYKDKGSLELLGWDGTSLCDGCHGDNTWRVWKNRAILSFLLYGYASATRD